MLQYYEESDPVRAAFGNDLSEEQWKDISEIKDVYGDVLFTSPLVAANVANPLLKEIESELETDGRVFSFLCGHDSNVGSVLAALKAEPYTLPGAIAAKTPIGCKLVFCRWQGAVGNTYITADLVYQTVSQLRSAAILDLEERPQSVPISFGGLKANAQGMYPEQDFMELLESSIAEYDRISEAYPSSDPAFIYEQDSVRSVKGRQGVCVEGNHYWVSGSTTLTKYDAGWNEIASNDDPFRGFDIEVNHIGDIDVYNNEIYLGVEYFMDGVGKNIQVAVYDGDTLELKRVFPFRSDTGQLECSGIAVDPDSGTVYMSSWIDDESSSYLYMYDLYTEEYKGAVRMESAPKWLQGVACCNGSIYVTSDDGDADKNEADHLYRIDIKADGATAEVVPEKAFDDVLLQGEIEGLSFDSARKELLLLYNRGARIASGMPKGFYDGYTEEIHEVYVYDLN